MIARLGDRTIGVCSAHLSPITVGGTITSSAGTVTCEGPRVARLTDIVTLDCGHFSAITTAAKTVTCEGLRVARLGDLVQKPPYDGRIISSASTVTVE